MRAVAGGENKAILAAPEYAFQRIQPQATRGFGAAVTTDTGYLKHRFNVRVEGDIGAGGSRRELA